MRAATQRALRQALQLAAPGGFVRPFLDERERLVELEGDLGRPGGPDAPSRSFVERIVGAAPSHRNEAATPTLPSSDALTDREKEILRLLAEGVSTRDIGSAIFVSENTVKYHLKNIYSKLTVAGRVQAIEAARRLGVIA